MPPSWPVRPAGLGAILEGAVARVAVKGHGLGGVEGRHGEIEQAVVVEIIHDRAAGLVEAVDPRQVADVAELADVELGLEEMVERDQEPRIDLVGMLAQRHVGQVQEPADLEVVGELLEILGEMADRQPRAGGIGVNGGRQRSAGCTSSRPGT